MKYKMIALDLDGTLTNSQKIITPETKDALFEYQEQGGKVILASGRPTYGIVPLAEELCLKEYGGYILSFNGGCIISCETEKILFNQTMELSIVQELHELAQKHKVNIMTYEDKTIYTEDTSDSYAQIEQKITKMDFVQVSDISRAVTRPVNKCLMTGEPAYLAQVEEKVKAVMGNRINVYRSQDFFLELVPQNIDKAASLDFLLKKFHLTRDNLIACGDGFNDLSMIQYAGLGVAMSNGQDGVKKVANYVAPSNDEDGIADVLRKFVFVAA